jgi:hypothetical protein
MDRDDIERHDLPPAAQGDNRESVHAHLRGIADGLDDRPTAAVERAARDTLARLDTLQAELEIPSAPPASDAGR